MLKNKVMLLIASTLFAIPAAVHAQGVTPTAGGKGNTVSADQLIARYTALAGSAANASSLVNGLRNGANISLIGAPVAEMAAVTVTDYGACPAVVVKDFGPCPPVTVNTYGPCPPKPAPPGGVPLPPDPTCRIVTGTTTVPAPADCKVDLGTTHTEPPAPGCKVVTGSHQEQKPTGKMIDPPPVVFSPGQAAPMGFGNVDIALALTEARLGSAPPTPTALKTALLEILSKRAAGEGWGKIAKSYGFQLQE